MLETTPLTPILGARITGLDIARGVDGPTMAALRRSTSSVSTTGSWKHSPKARISIITKSRYASMSGMSWMPCCPSVPVPAASA